MAHAFRGARRMWATALTVALLAGCSASSIREEGDGPGTRPTTRAELGEFPAYPDRRLPTHVAAALQAALDEAVAEETVRGVTAAVIAIGAGTWSGAAGVDVRGRALAADSVLPTSSVGKTVVAAQILQLVEQGWLGLDDPAIGHAPPGLSPADLNGATIRDLLGMRSGFTDPPNLDALDARGDLVELVAAIERFARPDEVVAYASVNYYLLGMIIEQVTGQRFPRAVRAGVLYPSDSDWQIERVGLDLATDAATLARWGYELYGGSVIGAASLREMTNFRGEFYGLGAIDFTHPDAEYGYNVASVGHGGLGESHTVRLVVFPETGVIVAVQANANGFSQIHTIVESLRDAART